MSERVSDERLGKLLGVCRRENVDFDERYAPLDDLIADLRDARARIATLKAERARLATDLAQTARELESAPGGLRKAIKTAVLESAHEALRMVGRVEPREEAQP